MGRREGPILIPLFKDRGGLERWDVSEEEERGECGGTKNVVEGESDVSLSFFEEASSPIKKKASFLKFRSRGSTQYYTVVKGEGEK